jgi:hypothetical protein
VGLGNPKPEGTNGTSVLQRIPLRSPAIKGGFGGYDSCYIVTGVEESLEKQDMIFE